MSYSDCLMCDSTVLCVPYSLVGARMMEDAGIAPDMTSFRALTKVPNMSHVRQSRPDYGLDCLMCAGLDCLTC